MGGGDNREQAGMDESELKALRSERAKKGAETKRARREAEKACKTPAAPATTSRKPSKPPQTAVPAKAATKRKTSTSSASASALQQDGAAKHSLQSDGGSVRDPNSTRKRKPSADLANDDEDSVASDPADEGEPTLARLNERLGRMSKRMGRHERWCPFARMNRRIHLMDQQLNERMDEKFRKVQQHLDTGFGLVNAVQPVDEQEHAVEPNDPQEGVGTRVGQGNTDQAAAEASASRESRPGSGQEDTPKGGEANDTAEGRKPLSPVAEEPADTKILTPSRSNADIIKQGGGSEDEHEWSELLEDVKTPSPE